jgi:hypothetical protein
MLLKNNLYQNDDVWIHYRMYCFLLFCSVTYEYIGTVSKITISPLLVPVAYDVMRNV